MLHRRLRLPRQAQSTAKQFSLCALRELYGGVKTGLERKRQQAEATRDHRMAEILSIHGIAVPNPSAKASCHNGKALKYRLDASKQPAVSDLVINHGYTLQQVVELSKRQSTFDPRFNKALSPKQLHRLLAGYQHRKSKCDAALLGRNPEWTMEHRATIYSTESQVG